MENIAIDLFFEIGLGHPRQQLVLSVSTGGVADHALVFGELLVEHERIVPLEVHRGRLVLGLKAHAHGNSFRIFSFILERAGRNRKWIRHPRFGHSTASEARLSDVQLRIGEYRDSSLRIADAPRNDRCASLQAARWRRSQCRIQTVPCSRAPRTSDYGSK